MRTLRFSIFQTCLSLCAAWLATTALLASAQAKAPSVACHAFDAGLSPMMSAAMAVASAASRNVEEGASLLDSIVPDAASAEMRAIWGNPSVGPMSWILRQGLVIDSETHILPHQGSAPTRATYEEQVVLSLVSNRDPDANGVVHGAYALAIVIRAPAGLGEEGRHVALGDAWARYIHAIRGTSNFSFIAQLLPIAVRGMRKEHNYEPDAVVTIDHENGSADMAMAFTFDSSLIDQAGVARLLSHAIRAGRSLD